MITVVLLTLTATIAWGSLQAQMPRFRMVRAARSFKADLMNLRSLAVQSNRETRLVLTSSGGTCDSTTPGLGGSWEMSIGDLSSGSTRWDLLPEDAAEDGSDDDQQEARVALADGGRWVCLREWSALLGPGSGNADAIVFSPRGWVSNPASDFSAGGYMEFTFVNQNAALSGIRDEVTVMISRTGMIRLVAPLDTLPSGTVGTDMDSTTP